MDWAKGAAKDFGNGGKRSGREACKADMVLDELSLELSSVPHSSVTFKRCGRWLPSSAARALRALTFALSV